MIAIIQKFAVGDLRPAVLIGSQLCRRTARSPSVKQCRSARHLCGRRISESSFGLLEWACRPLHAWWGIPRSLYLPTCWACLSKYERSWACPLRGYKSCYVIIIFSFLFVVKEMTDLLYLFKILISDKKTQKYREFQPYWDKIFLPQAAEIPCIFKCFLYHLIYNANHDSETYFIILRFCLWQNFIFIFHQPCPA